MKITIEQVVEKMNLKVFTQGIDLSKYVVETPDVNRPALQLAGYYEHFEEGRLQIVGAVEHSYMTQMTREDKEHYFDEFLSYNLPCVIFCRNLEPDPLFVEIALQKNIPVLGTTYATSYFISEIIYRLSGALAPCISIHGVLVDVYGEGVLITGESGIGKSEAALELIRRGHRLVTDDVVEIRKINDSVLVGTSPDITRYFIEVRVIGIIDVKTLFGVECVKEKQNIDLVINLEDWKSSNEYDRLGLKDEHMEILGNKVVCHSIPIRPGRNLAVIVEAAAANHRQKKMGYNAAQELYRRVQENLANPKD